VQGSGGRSPGLRLETTGASGRGQRRAGDGAAEGGDPLPERCDRAGGGPVEEKPGLVLFDLGRPLEPRAAPGAGRRGGQRGGCHSRGAAGMLPDGGGPRQQEPPGRRQTGRGGGALALEVPRDRLALVFALPPGAVEGCIPLGGRGRLSGGHDTAGGGPGRHACGCDAHPPRLGPRGRGRRALLIDPAAGGRWLPSRRGEGGALRGEPAGRRPAGGRVTQPDRLAGHAAAAIAVAPMGAPLEDRGGSARTVPPDEARGPGPGHTH
jgi:hypothetical protein